MKINVYIRTNNEAFRPDPAYEIARILRELADRLDARADRGQPIRAGEVRPLYDVNGNTVGRMQARHS